jgi:SPP1 gp7 family putative phage head morphogenesis protein
MWTPTVTGFAASSDWRTEHLSDREQMLIEALGELRKHERTLVKGFRLAYKTFLQELDRIFRKHDGVPGSLLDVGMFDAPLLRLKKKLYHTILDIAPAVMAAGLVQARRVLQLSFADGEGSGVPAPEIPAEWYQWYAQTLDDALKRYTLRERERIQKLTEKATAEGWSIPKLASQLKQEIGSDVYWRAERVARTEVMRLFNLGHVGGLYGEPLVKGFQYAVVLDARTSHICRGLAGKWVPVDRLVRVPPFHPNCRTLLIPIFEDEVDRLSLDDAVTELQQQAIARDFGKIPESVLTAWRTEQPTRQPKAEKRPTKAGAQPPEPELVDESMLPPELRDVPLRDRGWQWYRDAGTWAREKYFPDFRQLIRDDHEGFGNRLRRLYQTNPEERVAFHIEGAGKKETQLMERQIDAIVQVLPARWLKGARIWGGRITLRVDAGVSRAFYDPVKKKIHLSANGPSDILLHEVVHVLSERSGLMQLAWDEIHQIRTAGEPLVSLQQFGDYASNEMARIDKYVEPYIGKEYYMYGRVTALELPAMVFQGIFQPYLRRLDRPKQRARNSSYILTGLAVDIELLDTAIGMLLFMP